MKPKIHTRHEVNITEAYVYKEMSAAEGVAYEHLSRYREFLDLGDYPVRFPVMLPNLRNGNGKIALTRIHSISPLTLQEHFGSGLEMNRHNAATLIYGLNKLAVLPPTAEMIGKADNEGFDDTRNFVLQGFANTNGSLPHLEEVLKVVELTQSAIEPSRRSLAHGDLTPSNCEFQGEALYLIDLENLTLARRGFDLARMYVFLLLNPESQDILLREMTMRGQLADTADVYYFWRTAAIRAWKELEYVHNGRHDDYITPQERDLIAHGLKEVILQAANNIVIRTES